MFDMMRAKSMRSFFATMCSFLRRSGIAWTIVISGCNGPGTEQLVDSLPHPVKAAFHVGTTCPGKSSLSDSGNIYFPEPVCDTYVIDGSTTALTAQDADNGSDSQKTLPIAWVSAALSDSQRKCDNFIGKFTGSQAVENTGFDVLALVLSGMASVFTPVNTVRALAAGSTTVQGTKAAVNSDLYQQMTMLLLTQQIDSTYFSYIDKYNRTFPPTGAAAINAFKAAAEYEKIQGFHRKCSIPFAMANISANQKPAANAVNGATMAGAPTKLVAGDLPSVVSNSVTFSGQSGLVYTVTAASVTPLQYSVQTLFQSGVTMSKTMDTDTLLLFLNSDAAQSSK